MQPAKCRILIIDASAHTVLMVEEPSGQILSEVAYPQEYTPTDIALAFDFSTAYLPATSVSGKNVILKLDIDKIKLSLTILPLAIPYPAQFTLSVENSTAAYLSEPGGALHLLDLEAMAISPIASPLQRASCVGLAVDGQELYSAWEHEHGGTVAVFNLSGKLVRQHDIAGIPTNVILDRGRSLLVPFTNTAFTGEGVAVFDIKTFKTKKINAEKSKNTAPAVITIQCPSCPSGLSAYPCHAAIMPDGQTAYIVNEDSASILVLNLKTVSIIDRLVIGRSISSLYLIPQSYIALATSNFFNDLCRIDLKNGELTAMTATSRHFLSYLAILPEEA